MRSYSVICDLASCRSVASGKLAQPLGSPSQFWLPKPIYTQLNATEMRRINQLVKQKRVSLITYSKAFLLSYDKASLEGVSMLDYFAIASAKQHQANLLCTDRWFASVSRYLPMPVTYRSATNSEAVLVYEPPVSGLPPVNTQTTIMLIVLPFDQPMQSI